MRKLILFLILSFSFVSQAHAWFTPRPSSSFIASQDVLAASSDSHSVGTSGNFWRSNFTRNGYFAYRGEQPSVIASFGVVYASTDGHLYFRNAAGTNTRLS